MTDKKFDNLFKESFSGYSPDVPSYIWDNIAAEKKKKRPAAFWLNKKTALLLFGTLLLLVSAGSYYIFYKKENSEGIIAHENNGSRQETVSTIPAAVIQPENKAGTASSKSTKIVSEKTGNNATAGSETTDHFGITPLSSSTNSLLTKEIKTRKNNNAAFSSRNRPFPVKRMQLQKVTSVDTYEPMIGEEDGYNGNANTEILLLTVDGFRDLIKHTTESKLSKSSLKPFTPAVKVSEECPGAPSNKYYIDAYISPDYAIKKYSDTGISTLVAKRKESLRFHSAFSAGLRYTRVFNNGMSVRTGFNFSQINEKFSYAQENVVQIVYVINNQGDTTDSYYVRGTRYKNSYNNYRTIDVPLVLGYELGNEKLRANINAGAVINIYSWQNGQTLDNDGNLVSITTGKQNNPYQYKTNVGIGFTAGASLYYKLNNRLYAMAEPYFRYNFSPMNKEAVSIQERFTTIGLRLGIRVDIK
jgi:hypothetical protein